MSELEIAIQGISFDKPAAEVRERFAEYMELRGNPYAHPMSYDEFLERQKQLADDIMFTPILESIRDGVPLEDLLA